MQRAIILAGIAPPVADKTGLQAPGPTGEVKPLQPVGAPASSRADEAVANDPDAGGAALGTCGWDPDAVCGLTDPAECSVHGGAKAEPEADDTKTVVALLRRLLPRRKDDGGNRRRRSAARA